MALDARGRRGPRAARSPARGTRSPFFAPYEAYATADGHLVVVGTGGDDGWERFCRAIGLEAPADDPRFADNAARVENAEALRARSRAS